MSAKAVCNDRKGDIIARLGTLRAEAKNLLRYPQYLNQIGNNNITNHALQAAERVVGDKLTPGEIASIFLADIDASGRLPSERSPEMCAMLWASFFDLLGEAPANEAGQADYEEAAAIVTRREALAARRAKLPRIWSGTELASAVIQPLKWLVDDLLPQGLFLLIGTFKLGKSWLVLSLCIAVALGKPFLARFRVNRHSVLYLALEDGPRRIRSRIEKLGEKIPTAMFIAFEWRRGAEGVEDLRAWLSVHHEIGLVVIDTLSKFRGAASTDDVWGRDYDELAAIKLVADEFSITILLVHHRAKAAREDIFQSAAGTNALSAAVDGSIYLDRKRGQRSGKLSVTGRDIPELEIALDFDSDKGLWTALDGDPNNIRLSAERAEVLAYINSQGGRSVGPSEVATATGRAKSTASELLAELLADGQLARGASRGTYRPLNTYELTELSNERNCKDLPFGSSARSCMYPTPSCTDAPEEEA
jgi:class 3 adenylate cyclase